MTTDRELDEFLDLLKILIREPSVVGAEYPFFRVLRRELDESGAQVTQYQGVLVAQGRRPRSCVLSAHIDRHGLVCTGPNEFQYAVYVSQHQGYETGDSISAQMAGSIRERFRDQRVHAYDPWSGAYIGQGVIERAYLCPLRENFVFEVEGLEHLRAGTPVAYLDRLQVGGESISGQLDNVLSVAMVVHAFRRGYQGTALFTAEEEAGKSWQHALAWFKRKQWDTQRLIMLDTSPYPDRASADAQEIVLRRKDAYGTFDAGLVGELEAACKDLGLRAGFKDAFVEAQNVQRIRQGLAPGSLGRTELGRLVSATGGRINGSTLQFPTIGYHTSTETASLASVRGMLALVGSIF
ncbi:peptidase M42 [soil metagenome]